jgi:hypothetical protein
MSLEPSTFDHHQERLVRLWERLVRTLGVFTVNVLLDRAIWQAAQQHPELARIQYGDAGISFAALADVPQPTTGAYEALYEEMLLIMARLLGRDMAQRLVDEIPTPETPEPLP